LPTARLAEGCGAMRAGTRADRAMFRSREVWRRHHIVSRSCASLSHRVHRCHVVAGAHVSRKQKLNYKTVISFFFESNECVTRGTLTMDSNIGFVVTVKSPDANAPDGSIYRMLSRIFHAD
jgi:hypothetical protein